MSIAGIVRDMKYRFLYRDQSAPQLIIDQYQAGQFITEPAFVDCSKLRGGLLNGTTLRYLILSKGGSDFGQVSANAKKFGLIVFPRNLVWKVIDKVVIDGVTQVFISPEMQSDSEEDIIMAAHEDFEQLSRAPAILQLNNSEWKNRLFFPIGLRNSGIPYPLPKAL